MSSPLKNKFARARGEQSEKKSAAATVERSDMKAAFKDSTQTLKQVNVRMPPETRTALKRYCADNDLTVQEVITTAIEDFLHRNE